MQFRLLQNAPGFYLNAENCQQLETLNLEEMPLENKCTMYWLKYTDQNGEVVVSDKKSWLEDFMIEKEVATNNGKCDFDYKIRFEEMPSISFSEWLRNDLFIELHTSSPKLVNKI